MKQHYRARLALEIRVVMNVVEEKQNVTGRFPNAAFADATSVIACTSVIQEHH